MKQIITLFFVLATISFSFAQSSVNMTAKKQKQELKIKSIDRNYETRSAADCILQATFQTRLNGFLIMTTMTAHLIG